MTYWLIEGIGINVDKVRPHLNKRKVINLILRHFPENEDALKWKFRRDLSGFDIYDFFDGCPFDNLADLLTYCDDTDTLTYGDTNGYNDGDEYFYYPPSMPWGMRDNEPQSIKEVHERIIDAVKVVTDLSDAEIESLIDNYISAVGCG